MVSIHLSSWPALSSPRGLAWAGKTVWHMCTSARRPPGPGPGPGAATAASSAAAIVVLLLLLTARLSSSSSGGGRARLSPDLCSHPSIHPRRAPAGRPAPPAAGLMCNEMRRGLASGLQCNGIAGLASNGVNWGLRRVGGEREGCHELQLAWLEQEPLRLLWPRF